MSTKLAVACLVVVACGGDRKPVPRPPDPHEPIAVTPSAAPVGACTLPPAPSPPPAATSPDNDADDMNRTTKEGRIEEGGEECVLADDNLQRFETAIRAGAHDRAPVASKPWDRKQPPAYMALVNHRLSLQPAEQKLLAQNGFVVLAKERYASFGYAFHEIYQSELPIYVSIDAILQAVYAANEGVISDLEDAQLAPALAHVLDAMGCALPTGEYPVAARRDLDVYLAVARALLRGDAPHSMLGDATVEAEAGKLVKLATEASEMGAVALFDRERVIDFTAYTPRSHYVSTEARQRYFRAAMWLSRLEFNLVSRSCRSSQPGMAVDPRETPREDVDALVLADLVDRAGVTGDVARLDAAWALLAGRREDISVMQLGELRKHARIAKLSDPDADTKLRAAIGNQFRRTARLHYMPEGSTELPAIATLLGPRVVPDAAATRPLVQGEIPEREVLHLADMGYVLGHDRALEYLKPDRAQFPELDGQLRIARNIVDTTPRGKDDLYSAWFDAVTGLARPIAGHKPSFMQTPAYADLHLDSALAAFGQIKHNFVLTVGESYFEGGCEVPDGYVEPAPAMYDALLAYAARGERAMAIIDPTDELKTRAYFHRLGEVLGTLRTIQNDELAGRALDNDERTWLSMVAETTPWTTGGPPTYTGWWFDLHRHRRDEGLASPDFLASFFTGAKIAYVGANAPALGVFVVDTGGRPRVVVGPVAEAYEHQGEVARRLTDADGEKLARAEQVMPWISSYTAPSIPSPPFAVQYAEDAVTIETKTSLGKVMLEPFDHHRMSLGTVTRTIKPGKTTIKIKPKDDASSEGMHVRIGSWDAWLELPPVGGFTEAEFGGYHRERKTDELE